MIKTNATPMCDETLDSLFAITRRHESALTLALQVGDELAGLVTAGRLVRSLRRTTQALDTISAREPSRRALLTMLQESTRGTHELLGRASSSSIRDPRRMTRWLMAPGRSAFAVGGPDLFELDATGVALQAAGFLGLHVAHCRLITDLLGASFTDVFVEKSDFTYSNLRRTLWQRAHLHQSFFRDSSFVDATFDGASFTDCDLRRADFALANTQGLATTEVAFIRCDLRGSNWTGRDLSRVSVEDCKVDMAFEVGALNPSPGASPAQRGVRTAGMQRSEVAGTRAPSRAPAGPAGDTRGDALCV